MGRTHVAALCLGALCVLAAGCDTRPVIPDLSLAEAAEIVSRAPEFNRYARLVNVDSLHHARDSMDHVTFGNFTFRYLGSAPDAPLIRASADFRWHGSKWFLNEFSYGCPRDCKTVWVRDGPDKKH